MENNIEVLQKIKNRTSIWSRNPTSIAKILKKLKCLKMHEWRRKIQNWALSSYVTSSSTTASLTIISAVLVIFLPINKHKLIFTLAGISLPLGLHCTNSFLSLRSLFKCDLLIKVFPEYCILLNSLPSHPLLSFPLSCFIISFHSSNHRMTFYYVNQFIVCNLYWTVCSIKGETKFVSVFYVLCSAYNIWQINICWINDQSFTFPDL